MSEHTLPDDFSRWPANPFELLGVPPGVGERELRRAYARLIRVYKPEQFPEHFRRIREAYEAARHYAPFFETPDEPADGPAPAPESPLAAERPDPLPLPRSLEEDLDEAWSWAVEGDEARAYARLLDLQNRHPERSDIYLRLHGLLSVAPELDTQRRACDFLTQGLRQAGGGGPCHELYRREIEDNPAEALTDRFAELLQATTQPGLLATFVQWRWNAAGRLKRFEVIGNDLPGLRARLAVDHEEIWLRLLASAAEQLAWAPAPTNPVGLPECLHEAGRLEHLQLRCADVFDRLEYLERVSAGWHAVSKKGNVPADLLELLARFWTRPFAEVRGGVTALLTAIAASPDAWVAHLDRINEVSPPLLSLFGAMLTAYQQSLAPDADDREPEELEGMARHFLEEHGGLRYLALRPRLLAFCLREWIDPVVVIRLAQNQVVLLLEALGNKLLNDWPLRHVYRACTLLWS